MAEVLSYAMLRQPAPLEHNRRGWLIAIGVLMLLGTVAAGLIMASIGLVGLVVFGDSISSKEVIELSVVLGAGTIGGGGLTWLGVDTIRCRRWVRPAVIAIAWLGIVAGCFMAAGLLIQLIDDANHASHNGFERDLCSGSLALMVGFGLCIAAIRFFGSPSVRQTLEAYQPSPGWADACPLPRFILCAGLIALGLLCIAASPVSAVPVFGTYLVSERAAAVLLQAALVMFLAAVWCFKGLMRGWCLAWIVVAGFASAIVTFLCGDMMGFYERAGFSPGDLRAVRRSQTLYFLAPIVLCAAAMLLCAFYLLRARRYFAAAHRAPVAP